MSPAICDTCNSHIHDPRVELAIYWERECQEIRESAKNCRVCALLSADLHLVSGTTARIYFTFFEPFLDPENDQWGLMCGLNNTPLRYLLRRPEDIEHLLVEQKKNSTGTDSPDSFDMARSWLETCVKQHKHCQSIDTSFRPTRLLRIDKTTRSMRLCEGTELPQVVKYATLSHCWGGDVPGKLINENIDRLKTSIDPDSLGQNFRDAAKIALELGLEFIWIDSFCIIQNSPEDWRAESVKMSMVYGNSACNIAATSASNSSGGCFRTQEGATSEPIKLVFGDKDKPLTYLTDVGQWSRRFRDEPLNRRAWIVQERLLSPRNIHYERDQLVWECNELFASERFPKGFGNLIQKAMRPLRVPLGSEFRNAQEDEIPGQALREIWRPIVHSFTSTNITKPTDRLIALQGVGSRIENVCSWPYVAGMFLKNLQSQLCWVANGDPWAQRPDTRIAPSWSWVSVNQSVNMMPQWDLIEGDTTGEGPKPENLQEEYLCQVLDVKQGIAEEERSGHISSAELRVSCYLVRAEWLNPHDIRKESLRNWASKLQEHRTMNELRFRTRPLWTDFKFMDPNEAVAKRRADDEDPLISGEGAVKISWDFWNELSPTTVDDLWFMPAYKVREYGGWQPSTSYDKWQAVHGLILQAARGDSRNCAFRRCGTFSINEGWQEFWEHALSFEFESTSGIELLCKDGILVPGKNDKDGYSRSFTRQGEVLQYEITIV